MLLDSNIIIYLAHPEYEFLLDTLEEQDLYVSVISEIEVFGYHKLDSSDYDYFTQLFEQMNILPLSSAIVSKAIEFKKLKKMSLGDSIIAATASIYKLTLITRNTKDFEHIEGLDLLNPFGD